MLCRGRYRCPVQINARTRGVIKTQEKTLLTDSQLLRVAQFDSHQIWCPDLNHCEICMWIFTDESCRQPAPIRQRHLDRIGPVYDVAPSAFPPESESESDSRKWRYIFLPLYATALIGELLAETFDNDTSALCATYGFSSRLRSSSTGAGNLGFSARPYLTSASSSKAS